MVCSINSWKHKPVNENICTKKVGDGKLIFTFVTVLKRKIVLTKLNFFLMLKKDIR